MDLSKIIEIKKIFQKKGFIVDGVTGSYARDEQYNDIDIVYHLNQKFLDNYDGFDGFNELSRIKNFIATKLDKKIDLIDKTTLNEVGKKYILRDLINV